LVEFDVVFRGVVRHVLQGGQHAAGVRNEGNLVEHRTKILFPS
jgi:hypothetical protein